MIEIPILALKKGWKNGVTRRKSYWIEFELSGLILNSVSGLLKRSPLTNTKCRLWRVECSRCALNAAHSVLLKVSILAKVRSSFPPTFIVTTSKIVTVCVFAAGTFYFTLSPHLNIYLLRGFLLTVLHCLQIWDFNRRLSTFSVTPI